MTDFRNKLYQKYDSTFKQHISAFDEKSIAAERKRYKFRYLPLLKDYPRNASILEIGCGRGFFLEFLRNQGYENLQGIDISEEQIKIASSKKLNVDVADALQYLQMNKSSFDIILALDFVEHFNKEEITSIVRGVFEHLNKGGIFIIHTPNGQAISSGKMIYGDLTHLTIFTPNSAQQILRYAGFEKISFYETAPLLKNLKGTIRLILWKMIKFSYNIFLTIETGKPEKILTRNFICAARKT
ncbi:MAG: hypothetical protein A2057_06580 [Ignavibacteria bacterium GWA2_35_9]|nr:MAG: hypothetical protein A2057_06580 [Ignavibacteria bacterium GWA2_35_9]OGU48071.1 MAG: hypothetical protein A2000_14425 [Ignavibacteria bacterium GWB2_36_8]OGU48544.1 MAG: hypothetical protein A2080_08005 [Ignavibacteria bacterium GWC2_36_12]